jgi:hypothetical protein
MTQFVFPTAKKLSLWQQILTFLRVISRGHALGYEQHQRSQMPTQKIELGDKKVEMVIIFMGKLYIYHSSIVRI